MCGIAGFWQLDQAPQSADPIIDQAQRMAATLAHRGPDDSGLWHDPAAGIALAHRRLSIIDLSPEGHQPMSAADGRYVTVFNGEIYNYRALRDELVTLGYPFRGHSDTEVLLAAVIHWGLDKALPRLNGMFAFALWDRRARRLHLVRDRLGKKPLYFGRIGQAFVFASELKAFKPLKTFSGEPDRQAVALYLRFGFIPAPWCIYKGLYKLGPGSILSLDHEQAQARFDPEKNVRAYWSASEVALRGLNNPLELDEEAATDALQELMQDAVAHRMVADVPVGAFLSGGIDSSLIVALMQAQSRAPVQTFSLGFEGFESNETPHAKAIADYLGTEHRQMHVSGQEVIDNVPKIPDIVDEPLTDFAQVPNYLIAALARPSVKVVLSGDGGDELFCGYPRLTSAAAQWQKIRPVPRVMRRLASRLLIRWPAAANEQSKHMKTGLRIASRSVDELYFYKLSRWLEPDRLIVGAREPATAFLDNQKWPAIGDPLQRTLLLELAYHLPEAILVKVDRTSMAASLEVRSPLLDYRIVEWAWRLPLAMKTRGEQGKWILHNLLARYLPRSLFERPKQGFAAPIGQWLDGPLRDWADDLLAPDRLRRQGLLDPEPVRRLWQAQRAGQRQGLKSTWNVLMLQAWLDRHVA